MARRLSTIFVCLSLSILSIGPVWAQGGAESQRVTLDFRAAPLENVVRFFAEFMDQNFIIARELGGKKITVLAPKPVSRDEAWVVLSVSLSSHGLTMVRAGKYLKIIDAKGGASQAPLRGRVAGQMVTRVVELESARASELEAVLSRLVSPEATVLADPRTNALIVVERPAAMPRLARIIEALDVPSDQGGVRVIKLRHARARDVARLLEEVGE